MRLYHHTNDPYSVLPGSGLSFDDVELTLTRTSARSRDYDVVIRIDIPDGELDRLTADGHGTWTTTNTHLILSGAEVDCATDEDRDRVGVYTLAVERNTKLETIGRLNRYIEDAIDRPEASGFTMTLRVHEDELTDLENAIAAGIERFGLQHLDGQPVGRV